jgi:nitrate/nitrite transporter NarK
MAYPSFLPMIPKFFRQGDHAATATAIILVTSNVAGFVLPFLIGYLKLITGGYRSGLICAAAIVLDSTGAAMRLPKDASR